jgi:hypothetical protein
MKTSNLLIVSGLALVGGYFFFRKKKDKTDTQLLVLQNTQPQTATLSQLEVESKPNKQAIITPQEATVYATKTIAEVNSLMVKYPPLTMQQVVDNYNSIYKTDLIIDTEGKIVSPKNNNQTTAVSGIGGGLTSSVSGFGSILAQISMIKESDYRASDANRQFKGQQMIYTRFKSDFSTVYSDLKNYYSTLTKEQADFIIKYLPKMIIQAFMGDNDPRARANDFYTQEEIIDMVDNSFVKDTEELLASALGNFIRNYKKSIGEYSGEKTALAIASPKTELSQFTQAMKVS